MKKNLILGTACNYSKKDVEVFVKSWKQHLPESRLIIIIDLDVSQDTIDWLSLMGIEVKYFNSRFFIPSEIHNTRYFRYLDILLEERKYIDKVFLTDVRDVYFQGNIFDEIQEDGLHCFLEDPNYTCGTEEFNNCIIKSFYGDKVIEELYDRQVICSGTTLGDVNSIIDYLIAYMEQLDVISLINSWEKLNGNLFGFDQAIHIYLMYKILNPVKNENGIGVGTVKLIDPNKLEIKDGKIFVSGKLPSVIHQWNVHHNLNDLIYKYLQCL